MIGGNISKFSLIAFIQTATIGSFLRYIMEVTNMDIKIEIKYFKVLKLKYNEYKVFYAYFPRHFISLALPNMVYFLISKISLSNYLLKQCSLN